GEVEGIRNVGPLTCYSTHVRLSIVKLQRVVLRREHSTVTAGNQNYQWIRRRNALNKQPVGRELLFIVTCLVCLVSRPDGHISFLATLPSSPTNQSVHPNKVLRELGGARPPPCASPDFPEDSVCLQIRMCWLWNWTQAAFTPCGGLFPVGR